jgi:hypothetical protein
MVRKWIVYGIVLVVLVSVGIIPAVQRKPADLPPGVLAEMWIPINDNVGVALNMWGDSTKVTPNGVGSYGTLMIKSHGIWEKVYLESAPAGHFLPVK